MSMKWATVTDDSPLRIRLDGDTTALPFEPESLVDPAALAVDDRVRCELDQRRVIIVGKSGGLDSLGLREVVRFTSSGTFSKADYPWARAIRVRCQGGGGAGGGALATTGTQGSSGAGGGGGGHAQSFITDLASSVPVTVGAGGAGSTGAAGGDGGDSSFGSLVIGEGGDGGNISSATGGTSGASGGTGRGGTGDVVRRGGNGGRYLTEATVTQAGVGGDSALGALTAPVWPFRTTNATWNGVNATGYGAGGSGSGNRGTQSAVTGGAGSPGLVEIEVYG